METCLHSRGLTIKILLINSSRETAGAKERMNQPCQIRNDSADLIWLYILYFVRKLMEMSASVGRGSLCTERLNGRFVFPHTSVSSRERNRQCCQCSLLTWNIKIIQIKIDWSHFERKITSCLTNLTELHKTLNNFSYSDRFQVKSIISKCKLWKEQ